MTVWEDAFSTADNLEDLGFRVTWEVAREDDNGDAGAFHAVDAPPPGSALQHIRDTVGPWLAAPNPQSDTLVLQVVSPVERVGTVQEEFPEAWKAIDRDDPRATAAALDRLGMRVTWHLVKVNPDYEPYEPELGETFTQEELDRMSPTTGGVVARPPAGTVIISVLGPNGNEQLTTLQREQRRIGIEVIAAEDAAALGG